jgi:hypothetical protein
MTAPCTLEHERQTKMAETSNIMPVNTPLGIVFPGPIYETFFRNDGKALHRKRGTTEWEEIPIDAAVATEALEALRRLIGLAQWMQNRLAEEAERLSQPDEQK